jgi:hypothetical protein
MASGMQSGANMALAGKQSQRADKAMEWQEQTLNDQRGFNKWFQEYLTKRMGAGETGAVASPQTSSGFGGAGMDMGVGPGGLGKPTSGFGGAGSDPSVAGFGINKF